MGDGAAGLVSERAWVRTTVAISGGRERVGSEPTPSPAPETQGLGLHRKERCTQVQQARRWKPEQRQGKPRRREGRRRGQRPRGGDSAPAPEAGRGGTARGGGASGDCAGGGASGDAPGAGLPGTAPGAGLPGLPRGRGFRGQHRPDPHGDGDQSGANSEDFRPHTEHLKAKRHQCSVGCRGGQALGHLGTGWRAGAST